MKQLLNLVLDSCARQHNRFGKLRRVKTNRLNPSGCEVLEDKTLLAAIVVDFNDLPDFTVGANLDSYLAGFGVSLIDEDEDFYIHGAGTVFQDELWLYSSAAFQTTVYDLILNIPSDSVSFERSGFEVLTGDYVSPAWFATAYDANGRIVATIGEPWLDVFSNVGRGIDARRFQLDAFEIHRVRFEVDRHPQVGLGLAHALVIGDFTFDTSETQPDIAATDLSIDNGMVNFEWTISGADLPDDTTVELYWSDDDTFQLGQDVLAHSKPLNTDALKMASSTPYAGSVAVSALSGSPKSYLLLVADPSTSARPNGGIDEQDDPISAGSSNNIAALAVFDIVAQELL